MQNSLQDVVLHEFKPGIVVNHEAGMVETIFEDVPYIAEPAIPGVYHYLDKYLAVDNRRIVGVCIWTLPESKQKECKELQEGKIPYRGLAAVLTAYCVLITFLWLNHTWWF